MSTLVLKLVLTPALIGTASLAGRRRGPAVSGWFVGLPLTSAPIAFFLALSDGMAFASAVALGTMAGTVSQAAFCLTYGRLALPGGWAGRFGWPGALLGGCLAFALATATLERVNLPPTLSFLVVIAVLLAALRLMPVAGGRAGAATSPLPRWDLPARMVRAGIGPAFAAASAVAVGLLAASLWALRRGHAPRCAS